MTDSIEARIEAFKERVETDGQKYCIYLFNLATIRLLAHKYAYYQLGGHFISDDGYDIEEQSWFVMGRALGLVAEDETSPCVGFDHNHPLAEAGKELASKLTIRGDLK